MLVCQGIAASTGELCVPCVHHATVVASQRQPEPTPRLHTWFLAVLAVANGHWTQGPCGTCHTHTLFVVHVAVVEDRHHRTIRVAEENFSSAIPLRSKLMKM